MELELFLWIKKEIPREKQSTISYNLLKSKVKHLYEKKYKLGTRAKSFNRQWIRDFKIKFNIPYHHISYHSHFIEKFMKTRMESKISSVKQVYSAAAMTLVWKNNEKYEQLTFLACANQSGSHKLKLKIIGDVDIDEIDENGKQIPVYYENQRNRLFLAKINSFQQWFQREFVPEVEKSLQAKGLPKRALLLIQVSTQVKKLKLKKKMTQVKKLLSKKKMMNMKKLIILTQEDLRMLTCFTTATAKPFSFKDVLTCVDTSMRWAGENHVDNGILTSLKDLRKEVTLRNYEDAHNVARMKD